MKTRWIWVLMVALLAVGFVGGYILMRGGGEGAGDGIGPGVAATEGDGAGQGRGKGVETDPQELVARVMADLRSEDRAAQTRGRKELAGLPAACRGWLKVRAGETLDEEMKALLWGRILEIDEELVWHPAPVSLHVANAVLPAIMTELAGQTSAPIMGNPYSVENRFTLDIEQAPFWEVIRRLSLQHPVGMKTAVSSGVSFLNSPWMRGPETQQMIVQGPWALSALWTFWGMKTEPAASDQLLVTVALDPRLTVLEIQMAYDPIRDESGKELLAGQDKFGMSLPMGDRLVECDLYLKERAGVKIPSWKVRARAVVALSSEEFDIPDIERHLNVPYTAGPVTVKCTKFYREKQLFWNMEATSTSAEVKPYHVSDIYDKNETILGRRVWKGNNTLGSGEGDGGPYRMHLLVPLKVKVMEVEFEVKDLVQPKG